MSTMRKALSTQDAAMIPDALPGELTTIAEIVGVEKAMAYAEKFGGVTVYFMRWVEDSEKWNADVADLVEAFGRDDAKDIVTLLAPGAIAIPNCKKLFIKEKHKQAAIDRANGVPAKVVARKYKMHERMVRRITQAVRQEAEQNQLALL